MSNTQTTASKLAFNFKLNREDRSRSNRENPRTDVYLTATPDDIVAAHVGQNIGSIVPEGEGWRVYGSGDRTVFPKKNDAARRIYEGLKQAVKNRLRREDLDKPYPESEAARNWMALYDATLERFDDYEQVKAAFIERVQRDPKDAISWRALGMAQSQDKHLLAARFREQTAAITESAVQLDTTGEVLALYLKEFRGMHDAAMREFVRREVWRGGGNPLDAALKVEEATAHKEYMSLLAEFIQSLDWMLTKS